MAIRIDARRHQKVGLTPTAESARQVLKDRIEFLESKVEGLEKAVKKAKKQVCKVCMDSPEDCDRYPCWRISIIDHEKGGG